MPGLLTECEDLFGTNNLYEVLNIKKNATVNEGNEQAKKNPKQQQKTFVLQMFTPDVISN